MKKIAIFQSDLYVGGITRSLINLLKHLNQNKFDIDLYIFSEKNFFSDELGENIHIFILSRSNKILKFMPFNIAMKFYIPNVNFKKKYDIAIDYNSFWHECAIGALKINAKKRIMWLHSDIIEKKKVEFRYRVVWNLQYSKIKYFNEFVAVSEGVKDSFYKSVVGRNKNKKVNVINNIINVDEIIEKSKKSVPIIVDPKNYNIVCIGHLGKEKGIDILINDFYIAYQKRRDIALYVIGDGPERKSLQQQINNLHLESSVILLGNLENPFPYERQMDALALTSRYEGQGIVLWEAKVLGLEVFMSSNLEKYNIGINGITDMARAFIKANKREKKYDLLNGYNLKIKKSLEELLG